MTITLITGANKGLGYGTARRLLALGHTVYAAARDAERGRRAAEELGARPLMLDVTDETSVAAAVATVREQEGHLDVLINNAGIVGRATAMGDTTAADMLSVYDTNVLGPVRMIQAFLPLLQGSQVPVIVNVSSGLGSFGRTTDPSRMESSFATLAYGSSKAALNMLTVQYAKAQPHLRINSVDPGYTATDINGNRGTQSVEEGTDAIVRMATIGADGPTGAFFDRHGPAPW